MTCDDNLAPFVGRVFLGAMIKNADDHVDEYGEHHEVQFLEVYTDIGSFTVCTHNEHNGYYGGFDVVVDAYTPYEE